MTTVDELDALLELVGVLGFRSGLFRLGRTGSEVLAGVRSWPGCADVFILPDAGGAHAYRTPAGTEVFAPREIFWWYGNAGPVWTLRAILTLPEPDHPCAPDRLTSAPPGSGLPGSRIPVLQPQP